MRALEFVQFDPIRYPARAQDLILHQRVTGYRAGDLERQYHDLGLEEDCFYVYGAMTSSLQQLLHPRPDRRRPTRSYRPAGLTARVLSFVERNGPTRPSDLRALGTRRRVVNNWGGSSSATTQALEELQFHGLLRVAWREAGTKVYETRAQPIPKLRSSPYDRLAALTRHIVRILAPISVPSLRRTLAQLRRHCVGLKLEPSIVDQLLRSGALEWEIVDGLRYLWPPDAMSHALAEVPRRVVLLAPFDPVVWDRARFEHLWGWEYRFEAYIPSPQRRFGYYAMPMFWGDRAIGWVNCTVGADGALDVKTGFTTRAPQSADFTRAFDREIAALAMMIRGRSEALEPSDWPALPLSLHHRSRTTDR
jgi:uncharacterized protein